MNYRLVIKLLGNVCIALGLAMAFSIPWACRFSPTTEELHIHNAKVSPANPLFFVETGGYSSLLRSMGICFVVGAILRYIGQNAKPTLFRREAIAVVVLSWTLATILGALPYYLYENNASHLGIVREPNENGVVEMSFIDALFESQSGFSTTGATVLSDVESERNIPRCILFWRSCTQFLGGIGIIVLLVAILGQGVGGKEVLRTERIGSPGEGAPLARVQSLAWSLFGIYVGLNAVLVGILMMLNLSLFDAICHAFSTMATGGFSTYNQSIGHFTTDPNYNGAAIEWVLTLFMFLGGTNFVLFFWCLCGQPGRLFRDTEWRTYVGIILTATLAVMIFGIWYGSFHQPEHNTASVSFSFRTSLFHVVSLTTSTGFVANQYDSWNAPAVMILLTIMFCGACAGSTSGGIKLFRVILGAKIVRAHIEQTWHPTVVRNVWYEKNVVNRDLLNNVAIYIALFFAVIVVFTVVIVAVEPDSTWVQKGYLADRQLLDVPCIVTTCLCNVGPGVGVIGAGGNFGSLTSTTKFLLTCIMLLGRLEIFVVLAILSPRFWRTHA